MRERLYVNNVPIDIDKHCKKNGVLMHFSKFFFQQKHLLIFKIAQNQDISAQKKVDAGKIGMKKFCAEQT